MKTTPNYKLTAITFTNSEDLNDYIDANIESWANVKLADWLTNFYTDVTFLENEKMVFTLVYAKKIRRPTKNVSARDCTQYMAENYLDWDIKKERDTKGNEYCTLIHGRTDKKFKGVKAKTWRGLLRIIKNLHQEWMWSRIDGKSGVEFLKKYDLIKEKTTSVW